MSRIVRQCQHLQIARAWLGLIVYSRGRYGLVGSIPEETMFQAPSLERSAGVVGRDPVDQTGEWRVLRGGGQEKVDTKNSISSKQ